MPGDEANKIPGTLQVQDGSRITLVTHEDFSPVHNPGRLTAPGHQQLILGLIGPEHVKLVHCNRVDETPNFGLHGIKRESIWHCRYALIGGDYQGEIPQSITSAEVRFALPDKWLPRPLGNADGLTEKEREVFEHHKRLQHPVRWNLGTVSIDSPSGATHDPLGGEFIDANGSAQSALRLEFNKPQPFRSLTDAVSTLQVLLSVATGKAAAIDELSVIDTEFDAVRLSLYYRMNLRVVGLGTSHPGLFRFPQIRGTYGIARWLDLLQDQTSLKQALVIDQFHEPAFTADTTNHLLMACEAYMRNRWLERGQANQSADLRNILCPMIKTAGKPFADRVGNERQWINKLGFIRSNQGLAHYQGYATPRANQHSLIPVNTELYLLVILCLLRDCGFSDDFLTGVVDRMPAPVRVNPSTPASTRSPHQP